MRNPPFLPPKIRLPFYTFSRDVWMATADWYLENENEKMAKRASLVVAKLNEFEGFAKELLKPFRNDFGFVTVHRYQGRYFDCLRYCGFIVMCPYYHRNRTGKGFVIDINNDECLRIATVRAHQSGMWRGFIYFLLLDRGK